jgi:ceramide glucosyltransferase
MRNHNRAQHPSYRRGNHSALDMLARSLLALFALERLLKLATAWHFFRHARRAPPPAPQSWPSVTLLSPLTRGAAHLSEALQARAALDYPAPIQHIFICDSADTDTQQIVSNFLASHPGILNTTDQVQSCHSQRSEESEARKSDPAESCHSQRSEESQQSGLRILRCAQNDMLSVPGSTTHHAEVLLVEPDSPTASLASKMRKLQCALPHAGGDVLCFMDDDVTPRPDALRVLVPYLYQESTGVAFGLPCFTSWHNTWSILVSALINAHMLLNFMTVPYLTSPFRINAQVFAFRRDIFDRVGGLHGLEQQIDDEFEIARRVRQHGLQAVQTPLIYDVYNDLPSAQAYSRQFKRWFVMPRQAMLPSLDLKERLIFGLLSFTLPFPSFLALLALSGHRAAWRDAALSLALFAAVHALCERYFLDRRMPGRGWLLLPIVAFWTPLHVLWLLLRNNEVEWRGQRLKLYRDGRAEILPAAPAPTNHGQP